MGAKYSGRRRYAKAVQVSFVLFFSCFFFFFSCSTQRSDLGSSKSTNILQEEPPLLPDWYFLGKTLEISPELMPSVVNLFSKAMRYGLQSKYYGRLCDRKASPLPPKEVLDFGILEEKSLEPIVASTTWGSRSLSSLKLEELILTSGDALDKFLGKGDSLSKTCSALKDYLVSSHYHYLQRKKSNRQRKKMRRGFRVHNKISWAQKLSFNRLMLGLRVRSLAEFNKLSRQALRIKSCPRNFSAALSLVAFNYFPQEQAIKRSAAVV